MKTTNLPDGIQHIALSFSGGGFRAATFSLGCASYLYHTPYGQERLWDKVKFISSASGGSITALVLANMLGQGKDFGTAYQHLLDKMDGDKLVQRVFQILEEDSYWAVRQDKRRNLINAFAIAYDEDLFEHATYGNLFKEHQTAESAIEEVCINTTEFNNGQNFRFGTRGLIGNHYLSLSKKETPEQPAEKADLDIVKKIRLGDILATSSCFPGGFEPLVYPRDFSWKLPSDSITWQQLGRVIKYKNHYSNEEIDLGVRPEMASFMDGGIDDNQGIYAYLMANDRKGKGYQYDLYLPADVSSNYLEHPWAYPKKRHDDIFSSTLPKWRRKLKIYKWTFLILTATTLITAIRLFVSNGPEWLGYLLLGLALGAGLLAATAYFWIKGKISKIKRAFEKTKNQEKRSTWKLVWEKYGTQLTKMPLHRLVQMAEARLSSVYLLLDTVYLKKIRRMSYDTLFDVYRSKTDIDESGLPAATQETADESKTAKNDTKPTWENKIGATAIYLLSTKNDWMLQRILKSQPWDFDTYTVEHKGQQHLFKAILEPGAELRSYIDMATEMETSLWFDDYHVDEKTRESLLIAGQATICFNLLLIVHRIDSPKPEWQSLKQQLLKDWLQFRKVPQEMIKQAI